MLQWPFGNAAITASKIFKTSEHGSYVANYRRRIAYALVCGGERIKEDKEKKKTREMWSCCSSRFVATLFYGSETSSRVTRSHNHLVGNLPGVLLLEDEEWK